MGFIEEGRPLIQEFVTPEIRAIDARLTAVEKKLVALEGKVDKADAKIDGARSALEAKMDGVRSALEGKIDRNHDQVMDALRRAEFQSPILERLAKVESKLQHVA